MYISAWCIEKNGALSVTIVGVAKNIVVTIAGMFVGGDYSFNWTNVCGLVIATIGVSLYAYAKFISNNKQQDELTKQASHGQNYSLVKQDADDSDLLLIHSNNLGTSEDSAKEDE